MDIKDAQSDMRRGYLGGAPGLFASAVMWLLAGLTATISTPRRAVIVLFVGGMAIHPLAVLFSKLAGRPGAYAKSNPLGALALEGTGILLLGVLLSLALSQFRVELFFPAMLVVIGGRYLTFQTLYGLSVYWVCGGVLTACGIMAAMLRLPVPISAFAGGLTELVFGVIVFLRMRGEATPA